MQGKELARIEASQPRRLLAAASLIGLGVLLAQVVFDTPGMELHWRVLLGVLALGTLGLAASLWKATSVVLILTDAGLYEDSGRELAKIENIRKVERGMFAMKPSNGFVVQLSEKAPAGFAPGLWWRLGRRLAVGGVVAGSQTRPVADMLSMAAQSKKQDS